MTKPLLLQFHDIHHKPKSIGLKNVLFKVSEGERLIGYDWGYANYNADGFETLGGADAPTCKVVMWAEMPSPNLLLG